ncbi:hypothetical protein GOP47_0017648 [Adiantum capillus-veneris]|uniref:Uncharacterized protein n=1 Tax=Adiantum capillus-veneris TaxID=13818 RepID=A0A9D4ZB09_ADICA|nr:hypothetical protein GOP47_0017648 [Adiantum capillus-veneris]
MRRNGEVLTWRHPSTVFFLFCRRQFLEASSGPLSSALPCTLLLQAPIVSMAAQPFVISSMMSVQRATFPSFQLLFLMASRHTLMRFNQSRRIDLGSRA